MLRYPFVAASILSSKSPIILEYFFSKGGKKSLEDDLFGQFEAEVLLIDDDKEEKEENVKIQFLKHSNRTKKKQASMLKD